MDINFSEINIFQIFRTINSWIFELTKKTFFMIENPNISYLHIDHAALQ